MWRFVALAVLVIAVALAGLGLHAPQQSEDCLRTEFVRTPDSRGGTTRAPACVEREQPAIDPDAAPWFWFGAGAVLVIGLGSVALWRRPGERSSHPARGPV